MTDGEIVKAASELTMRGKGATTEALAHRFGVGLLKMTERLLRLEMDGTLMSVALSADEPGMGHQYWVRPGEAARYFSPEHYDEFEARVRALAAWKGYKLVAGDSQSPPRLRRYSIESMTDPCVPAIRGNRLERALWKLRHLPLAGTLEQPVRTAPDVAPD